VFTFGKVRLDGALEIFNSLNSNVVLTENQNVGSTLGQPQAVLQGGFCGSRARSSSEPGRVASISPGAKLSAPRFSATIAPARDTGGRSEGCYDALSSTHRRGVPAVSRAAAYSRSNTNGFEYKNLDDHFGINAPGQPKAEKTTWKSEYDSSVPRDDLPMAGRPEPLLGHGGRLLRLRGHLHCQSSQRGLLERCILADRHPGVDSVRRHAVPDATGREGQFDDFHYINL
jgi:hypothetical protein